MLNIAIIGLGRIGKLHYQNIVNLKNKFFIKYLFDVDSKLNTDFNETVHHPDKLDNMLKTNKIDAIFICSPTKFHFDQIITSLENKVNVFVEKPISLDKDEIIKSFEKAESLNLKLLVGFNRRFDPKIRDLKKKYINGEIENLQQILVISRDYPYPEKKFIEVSGGIFHDCIIHDLDSICWILNKYPISVTARGSITSKTGRETGHLDNVTSILEFETGEIATLISSRIGNSYDQRIEFMGSSRSISIKNNKHKKPISFPERYQEAYQNEINDFYHLITKNQINDSLPNKTQCLKIHELTELLEFSLLDNLKNQNWKLKNFN